MRRAAGEHELAQRRELRVPARRWPPRAAPSTRRDGRDGGARLRLVRRRELGARRRTAPACTRARWRSISGILDDGAHRADRGVQLVHLAVGVDPRVALPHARPPEQARVPAVAASSCRSSRCLAYQRHDTGRNARRGGWSRSSRRTRPWDRTRGGGARVGGRAHRPRPDGEVVPIPLVAEPEVNPGDALAGLRARRGPSCRAR